MNEIIATLIVYALGIFAMIKAKTHPELSYLSLGFTGLYLATWYTFFLTSFSAGWSFGLLGNVVF